MEKPRDLPAVLYKYMSAKRSAIFDDWLIRFTQPKALNDPFEMRPHIGAYGTSEEVRDIATRRWEAHARERYEVMVRENSGGGTPPSFEVFRSKIEHHRAAQIEKAMSQAGEYTPLMVEKIDGMMNDNIGILSLCEHKDNLLMWSHYGESHRGFVIAFDTSSPFFHQTTPPAHVVASPDDAAKFAEEYGRLRDIRYEVERPSIVVTQISFDTIMAKGKAWEYEGEWRMLMPPDYADVNLLPRHDLPICLFAVPPSSVKEVILGCNADDELLARALTLRERLETRHIRVVKARVDDRHFHLNFEDMP